jgi:hypothetical protein
VSDQTPLILHADQEHSGLRFAVLVLIAILFFASFFILRSLLRAALPGFNTVAIVACLGAVPVSLAIAAVGEKVLKMTWHSGRRVVVMQESIRLEIEDERAVELNRNQGLNQLWWYFELGTYPRGGRERRIPGSWYCAAGQLQQDGDETVRRIVIYSYLPPKRLKALLADGYEFVQLDPTDVYETSMGARFGTPKRPELPPELIASRVGKYWLAERNRWREGVELTAEDFARFLQTTELARES